MPGDFDQISIACFFSVLLNCAENCLLIKITNVVYRSFLLILSMLAFRPATTSAQDSVSVTHLSIDQGLSNNSVRCIYQDHNGFMWFGTYDGLNRYDGYDFKVFRNNFKNSTSLINNWINAIDEDNQGNLWVGTRQGVAVYRSVSDK